MEAPEHYDWYAVLNGSRIGPMNWETLRERVTRGQIAPTDLVWAAPFGAAWTPAGRVPGLFPEPPPPPPPPNLPPPIADAPPRHDASPAWSGSAAAPAPGARVAWRHAWTAMMDGLFRPFDLARWFSIGFCAWLSFAGGGGPKGIFNADAFKASLEASGQTLGGLPAALWSALPAAPFVSAAILFSVAVWLMFAIIFCWLRAHGSMMFLHRIAHPDATIREAWRVAGPAARPLFWWRLGLGVGGGMALLALVAGAGVSIGFELLRSGDWSRIRQAMAARELAAWGGGFVTVLFIWSLLKSLSFHFLEPILFRRQAGLWAAWQRVWAVCRDHPFAVMRYYVLFGLVMLAATMVILLFVIGSCCLGVVLLVLPVIGGVVLLPLLWVRRELGVAFLRQIDEA